MEPRLNVHRSGPDAMKAMPALEQQIARSGLEPLRHRVPETAGL